MSNKNLERLYNRIDQTRPDLRSALNTLVLFTIYTIYTIYNHWFKWYGNFVQWVYFAYWWSCIGRVCVCSLGSRLVDLVDIKKHFFACLFHGRWHFLKHRKNIPNTKKKGIEKNSLGQEGGRGICQQQKNQTIHFIPRWFEKRL